MINSKFKKMNIVITGGSRGIGKAIAEKFVLNGAHIFLCGRDIEQLKKTQDELRLQNPNSEIFIFSTNLAEKNQVELFANEVLKHFDSIDVLVNNAGSFLPGEISTEPEGLLETMMNTNLFSAYHLSRFLIPTMKKNQKGHIINMCSVASLQAYKNGGAYSISKFALLGFSKNLRQELMPFGIKVSSISPGATMSDSWSGSGVDENRIMKASDIAEVVWTITQLSSQAVIEDIVLRPLLGDL